MATNKEPKSTAPGEHEPDALVNVRVVRREDQVVLVEWQEDNDYKRGIIPAKMVQQGQTRRAVLEKCIPHGVQWETLFDITTTAKDVARAMRQRGLFTLEDVDAGGIAIQKAFAEAFAKDLIALLTRAREENKKGKLK